MDKKPKISLILEAFRNLEKAYVELKKLLQIPKEEFLKKERYREKARTLFNLAFENTMRVCRHLSVVYGVKSSSKDCLVKVGELVGFPQPEKLKVLIDFYLNYRDPQKEVDPEFLWEFLSENLPLFKEFARSVVEFVKKTTGNYLLIDYDLLNEKARHVKESLKRIEFVLSQGREAFSSTPMYYDRAKYFYQVAYDALTDVCRHLAPKMGIRRVQEDCLTQLAEAGILPKERREKLRRMKALKDLLTSTWEVPPEKLYEELEELKGEFEPLLKELAQALKELLKKKAS